MNISFRNWFLDYHVEFPDGTVICVDHLWALIDKVQSEKTDFTAGYQLSSEHLEVEGSDRWETYTCEVKSCKMYTSETTMTQHTAWMSI